MKDTLCKNCKKQKANYWFYGRPVCERCFLLHTKGTVDLKKKWKILPHSE
jgi:hypothetical protein